MHHLGWLSQHRETFFWSVGEDFEGDVSDAKGKDYGLNQFESDVDELIRQDKQDDAARIITGSRFDDSAMPIIKALGWQTIEEMISSQTKIMVFKALNGRGLQYLTELFSRNSQSSVHKLRNTSNDLKLPLMKTATGQRCFSFRGVKSWNSLSVESKKP